MKDTSAVQSYGPPRDLCSFDVVSGLEWLTRAKAAVAAFLNGLLDRWDLSCDDFTIIKVSSAYPLAGRIVIILTYVNSDFNRTDTCINGLP